MDKPAEANQNAQLYFKGNVAGYILLETEQGGSFSFIPYRNFTHLDLARTVASGSQPTVEIMTPGGKGAAIVVELTPRTITLRNLETLKD